jgi:hypothetical protein
MSNLDLIEEAKRRYPSGTVFKSCGYGNPEVVIGNEPSFYWHTYGSIAPNESGGLVYKDGKWAEIVSGGGTTKQSRKLLLTNLYMKLYAV